MNNNKRARGEEKKQASKKACAAEELDCMEQLSAAEQYATGLALLELGSPEGAIEAFQFALAVDPKDSNVLVSYLYYFSL